MFCRRGALAALSIGFLALTACSSGAADETTPANAPSVETVQEPKIPSPTPPARNDRGDLIKEIGEPAGVGNIDAESPTISFTVDSVEETECTDPLWTPDDLAAEGNRLIAVDITAITQPASGEHQDSWDELYGEIDLTNEWISFGADGQRMNDAQSFATMMCLSSSEQLPSQIGPGESVQGVVVLEVSDRAGEIAFRPWWLDGGWSWSYDLDGPEGLGA